MKKYSLCETCISYILPPDKIVYQSKCCGLTISIGKTNIMIQTSECNFFGDFDKQFIMGYNDSKRIDTFDFAFSNVNTFCNALEMIDFINLIIENEHLM